MFNIFQIILKELRLLCKIYENFEKILRTLPRQWKPQVTTPRNSESLWYEVRETCWNLKVHELELQKGGLMKKERNIALKAQKQIKRTPTKTFSAEESLEESYLLEVDTLDPPQEMTRRIIERKDQ